MRATTSRRDKENGQSPEERRDALFERIEELTGREFPRNQFPQQSDKYPDEANEAIRSLSDVLGAINSRNRGQMLSKMLTELEEEGQMTPETKAWWLRQY